MHSRMPRQTLETLADIYHLMNLLVRIIQSLKIRIHLKRHIKRDIQFLWNHLGYIGDVRIRKVEHTTDIADDTFCCHRTKCHDLHDLILAVFIVHIIYYFLSSLRFEIDINIRHRHSFRIKESFK